MSFNTGTGKNTFPCWRKWFQSANHNQLQNSVGYLQVLVKRCFPKFISVISTAQKRWQTHPSHDSKFTFFIINLRRYTENVWNTISVPLCLYLVDSILLQRQVPLWVMVFNFRWSKKVIVKDKADSEPICSNRVFGDPAQHNCAAKYNEAICYCWREGFR